MGGRRGFGFQGGRRGKSLPESHAQRETLNPAAQGVRNGQVGRAPMQSHDLLSAAQDTALDKCSLTAVWLGQAVRGGTRGVRELSAPSTQIGGEPEVL